MELEVIKKDGTHEGWDWDKIEVAIHKAAQRANATYSEHDIGKIRGYIESIIYSNFDEVPAEKLHAIVIEALCKYTPKIGESYKEFRDYKNTYANAFEAVKNEADTVLLWETRKTLTSIVPLCLPKAPSLRAILLSNCISNSTSLRKRKRLLRSVSITSMTFET